MTSARRCERPAGQWRALAVVSARRGERPRAERDEEQDAAATTRDVGARESDTYKEKLGSVVVDHICGCCCKYENLRVRCVCYIALWTVVEARRKMRKKKRRARNERTDRYLYPLSMCRALSNQHRWRSNLCCVRRVSRYVRAQRESAPRGGWAEQFVVTQAIDARRLRSFRPSHPRVPFSRGSSDVE